MVCFGSQNISELKFLNINCGSSLLDYMLMFLEQNGGQSDNTNIANKKCVTSQVYSNDATKPALRLPGN